jgi:hypothetical protein
MSDTIKTVGELIDVLSSMPRDAVIYAVELVPESSSMETEIVCVELEPDGRVYFQWMWA